MKINIPSVQPEQQVETYRPKRQREKQQKTCETPIKKHTNYLLKNSRKLVCKDLNQTQSPRVFAHVSSEFNEDTSTTVRMFPSVKTKHWHQVAPSFYNKDLLSQRSDDSNEPKSITRIRQLQFPSPNKFNSGQKRNKTTMEFSQKYINQRKVKNLFPQQEKLENFSILKDINHQIKSRKCIISPINALKSKSSFMETSPQKQIHELQLFMNNPSKEEIIQYKAKTPSNLIFEQNQIRSKSNLAGQRQWEISGNIKFTQGIEIKERIKPKRKMLSGFGKHDTNMTLNADITQNRQSIQNYEIEPTMQLKTFEKITIPENQNRQSSVLDKIMVSNQDLKESSIKSTDPDLQEEPRSCEYTRDQIIGQTSVSLYSEPKFIEPRKKKFYQTLNTHVFSDIENFQKISFKPQIQLPQKVGNFYGMIPLKIHGQTPKTQSIVISRVKILQPRASKKCSKNHSMNRTQLTTRANIYSQTLRNNDPTSTGVTISPTPTEKQYFKPKLAPRNSDLSEIMKPDTVEGWRVHPDDKIIRDIRMFDEQLKQLQKVEKQVRDQKNI